jgi:hypothetical protein
MAAGLTYTPINTTVVSNTTTNTFTFSSIPSSYTDLVLVCNLGMNDGNSPLLQFNGDSGTNYSDTFLEGVSTSPSTRYANQTRVQICNYIGSNPNYLGTLVTQVMNYSNSSIYKTVLSRFSTMGGTYPGPGASVATWRSTAAINSLTVFASSFYFAIGSTFTLYGIAAA